MSFYYYLAVREMVKKSGKYFQYLSHCKRCKILLIADPRNKGRNDIYCPFGCRELVKRNSSNDRVKEYYNSPEGKDKKHDLNKRRSAASRQHQPSSNLAPELKANKNILLYICGTFHLIYELKLSLKQLNKIVRELMRQHSMAKWGKYDYSAATPASGYG